MRKFAASWSLVQLKFVSILYGTDDGGDFLGVKFHLVTFSSVFLICMF